MNLRKWPAIGSMLATLAAAVTLAGCGSGSSDSSDSSVRVINATLTHSSIDLLVNSSVAASATATDGISSYVTTGSGSNTLQLADNGSSTALVSLVPTLSGDSHYTLLAYESGTTVKALVVDENASAPSTSGIATVRIYDVAIEAGKLDVYITTNSCTNLTSLSATTSFGTLTAPTYTAVSQGAGTYNVCVTAAGSKTDLRSSMAITLSSQEVVDVLLTPTSGGQLINAGLLSQQSTYTAARNTNTRVRLASAVSSSATVAASASSGTTSVVIDSGSVAPAFGYYTLVPAGSSLNISVNGSSVSAPSTSLVAGNDMTLLVYGDPGSATASLFTDDNRLPTDSTTVKLRLINGITGSTGTLTFTANSAAVATGIATGAASGYTSVTGSSDAMTLSLFSSASSGVYYTTSTTLNANTVYTVLAAGAFSSPQLLIR